MSETSLGIVRNLYYKIKEKLGMMGWPPGVWLFPCQIKTTISDCGLKVIQMLGVGMLIKIVSLEEKFNRYPLFRWFGSRITLICTK